MADDSKTTFISVPLLDLSSDREFPASVYLCIHHKMVRYRSKGDKLDADAFNKLVYNQVKYVFVEEASREAFQKWVLDNDSVEKDQAKTPVSPEVKPALDAVQDQRRAMMDIFASPKDEPSIKQAVDSSKKMVSEFLRKPFALNSIQMMQKYSKGCVDHSVNVSILSVFLGLRMGYSHQLILENLALAGLFHDIGKVLVESNSEGMINADDPAMQQHPKVGAELLSTRKEISNEVRMIVAQHHEFLDGTGYPARLKGLAIYDLARLVAIANLYDNMISQSMAETMKERAEEALNRLEQEFEGKLDPKKLEKAIKILRYSFL